MTRTKREHAALVNQHRRYLASLPTYALRPHDLRLRVVVPGLLKRYRESET